MLKPTAHRNISNYLHRHFLPNQKPFLVQEESLLRLSETHGEIIHFTHFHIGPLSGIQNEVKEEESRLEGDGPPRRGPRTNHSEVGDAR